MSTGAHTDMWDGMVTFLVTESMAIKHSAMLYPDIPTITKSTPADAVRTMMLHETELYKHTTGKYSEWILEQQNQHKQNQSQYEQQQPIHLKEPVYTTRSLLLSAISVPFYYAAISISTSPLLLVTFFLNPLVITLTCLVIFCFSLEIYGSSKRRIAFALSLIFCVCSFLLPYNSTLFPQPLQALLLITAAFCLYKSSRINSSFSSFIHNNHNRPPKREVIVASASRYARNNNRKAIYFAGLGGFLLGLSVFSHPTSIIVIPGFTVYSIFSLIKRSKKGLICFLISLSLILFFMALVNYWRFESFTEFGFGGDYIDPLKRTYDGLAGLILSPGKGLVFYFPLVILLPLALVYMYKKNKERLLAFLIIYVFSIFWLYFGTLDAEDENKSRIWSGAIAWGPRYLVPVLPFIILPFGTLFSYSGQGRRLLRISLTVLCIAGFIINLPGKLVWSEYGLIYAIDKGHMYRIHNRVDVMTWNAYYSPIVLHMKALLYDTDYISNMPVEEYRYSPLLYFAAYGLAPCSYDLYIFCKLGPVPILILSLICIVLTIFILNGANSHILKRKQNSHT